MLIPKLTWNYKIKVIRPVKVFSVNINFNLKESVLLILNKTEDYRSEMSEKYFNMLFTESWIIGPLKLTPVQLVIIFFCLLFAMFIIFKSYDEGFNEKSSKVVIYGSAASILIYLFGLVVTYMNNFSEYESLILASHERYINIIFTALFVFICMVLINIFTSVSKLKNISIIFFAILIVLAPQQSIYNYLYKDNVKYSQIKMSPYIETSDRTKKYISKDNANIYIISQQDKGFDFLALRYNMRPNTCFMSGTPWSIGIPFYEGDIWTTEINGDEWKEILKSECDYVLLYRLNDYFINNYKSVFNEPEDIKEGELYKVNKSNGMLSLVKSTVN